MFLVVLGACQTSSPSADRSVCKISDRIITIGLSAPASETLSEAKKISPFLDQMRHEDLHEAASLVVAHAYGMKPSPSGTGWLNREFEVFASSASALSHLCVDKYRYSK